MEEKDYPVLYRISDAKADTRTERYFFFVKIKISILVIIAFFSSFILYQEPYRTLVTIFLVILLITSIFLAVITNIITKHDHVWFNCRAVAESVKTETWLFMMKMNFYRDGITNLEAVNRFIDSIRDILQSRPVVRYEISSLSEEGNQVTEFMIHTRNGNFEERKNCYIENRIQKQQIWFNKKSESNYKNEVRWQYISWFLQFLAVGSAIALVYNKIPIIHPVGIITTAAATATTWMHSKSFRELYQSYSMIAQELSLIESKANQIWSEEDLETIVLDTERVISREHSVLISRRLGIRPG